MMVKCGQIWKIKEYIRIAKNISYNHIFIIKIQRDKKYGDVVWFDVIGCVQPFEIPTNQTYLTWLVANCELVSG